MNWQFISYRLTEEGKKCTVKTITKGQLIGEEDVLSNTVRDTSMPAAAFEQNFFRLYSEKEYW